MRDYSELGPAMFMLQLMLYLERERVRAGVNVGGGRRMGSDVSGKGRERGRLYRWRDTRHDDDYTAIPCGS